MFSLLYDLFLLILGIIALPKLLWHRFKKGKYRESLKQRLGFDLPEAPEDAKGPIIWIHSISVGETRAVAPLYRKIREANPDATIFISTTTETGHAEAKRSMPDAAAYFFLPLDFSIPIRRAVKRLKPNLLILVESDFWYNLLKYVKKSGARIVLVNGKISERSASRFMKVPFFTKRLFSFFDILCIQSQPYLKLFQRLGIPQEKLLLTGNLKYDTPAPKMPSGDSAAWREELGIQEQDQVIVIASTHEPEEEWLLNALDAVWKSLPSVKVLLVPRHPERFPTVAALLKAKGLSWISYSQRSQKRGDERVVLIDAMGLLRHCYQLAEIAIVGGSFIDRIGGHNIFEPVQYGVPVLFGPHMHTQMDMVEEILKAGAGRQLSLSELPVAILELLEDSHPRKRMGLAGLRLTLAMAGATDRTWFSIQKFLSIIPGAHAGAEAGAFKEKK